MSKQDRILAALKPTWMTEPLTVCRGCLQPGDLDKDGLCDNCTDLNETLGGALLALLEDK